MIGKFGSINRAMKAGENIVNAIREKEANTVKKYTNSAGFAIQKLAVSAAPGTLFKLNGEDVVLPAAGVFEVDEGLIEIESLVFPSATQACVVYLI